VQLLDEGAVGLGKATVLSAEFPSFRFDTPPRLPSGWQEQVAAEAHRHSAWRELTGSSVTSREADFGASGAVTVGVVTGDIVARELPWLDTLYRTTILDAVNELDLGVYTTSADTKSAININSILPGGRYEWHVDSNQLTALLFVTTHGGTGGGELVFRPDPRTRAGESWELAITPESGALLVFDAREAAHTVQRVGGDGWRITVPMNFYLADGVDNRPADLDGYLYGDDAM